MVGRGVISSFIFEKKKGDPDTKSSVRERPVTISPTSSSHETLI